VSHVASVGPAQRLATSLMERFQISSDEAFRMLVHWSQNWNVKLRAVAAQLVWPGELPMGGGAS
jgi:AmiR/NasT family two-component response regulator